MLTTNQVDSEGKSLLPKKNDLPASYRVAQPWLTARQLLDNLTSFLGHWIPNTHCIPLASYGPRNELALVVDYSLEIMNAMPVDH